MASGVWVRGPMEPTLSASEVHVWRASLEVPREQLEALRTLLSPDEHERAAAFYFEEDRSHYVAGRGILRALLARYLGQPANAFRFVYNAYGKPSLPCELNFNISHSYGLALFGFVKGAAIGVDVERIRPEVAGQDIAERFFSAEEAGALMELPAEKRGSAFFRCWTRKEAFIKAHGTGLSLPLREFTVDFKECGAGRLLSTAFDADARARWSLYGLEPEMDYAGAVAVEGADHLLRLWDWH